MSGLKVSHKIHEIPSFPLITDCMCAGHTIWVATSTILRTSKESFISLRIQHILARDRQWSG
jgi:hypothetical protein